MAMERRMPAQENSLDDLINQMLANRTSELKKQEEETARVSEEAGLVPEDDTDVSSDDNDDNDDNDDDKSHD